MIALVTSGLTYLGIRSQASSSNEGIYADHTKELWEKIDSVSNERDDLKTQVLKLQTQVENAQRTIDALNNQIGELTDQLKKYIGDEEVGK